MTGDDIGRIVRLAELEVLEASLGDHRMSAALDDLEVERSAILAKLSPRARSLRGYVMARLEQGRARRKADATAYELDLTPLEVRACELVIARRLLEESFSEGGL